MRVVVGFLIIGMLATLSACSPAFHEERVHSAIERLEGGLNDDQLLVYVGSTLRRVYRETDSQPSERELEAIREAVRRGILGVNEQSDIARGHMDIGLSRRQALLSLGWPSSIQSSQFGERILSTYIYPRRTAFRGGNRVNFTPFILLCEDIVVAYRLVGVDWPASQPSSWAENPLRGPKGVQTVLPPDATQKRRASVRQDPARFTVALGPPRWRSYSPTPLVNAGFGRSGYVNPFQLERSIRLIEQRSQTGMQLNEFLERFCP